MQRSRWSLSGVLVLTMAFGPGTIGPARAQEPSRPAAEAPQTTSTPRGGTLVKTGRHQFEVFFYKTGVRVFPRNAAEKPVAVSALNGTAMFVLPGVSKPFVYPLQGAVAGNGPAPRSLDLGVDLSKVPVSGTKVTFEIHGLADPAEPSATFTLPFALPGPAATATATPTATPRVVPATLSITRAAAADQPAINAQRVCRVSGAPLGSMGTPIKAARGDRAIFLCCQGCVKRIQANPDQYLGPR
jgi:hypothetical protein